MDDLKQAYTALGLPEDSSRESVEKRYDILLRQARSQQVRGEQVIDETIVHQAYRFIIENERKKSVAEYNLKNYGKSEGRSEKVEKIDHFFRYYRLHTIGAILLIILIVFGVKGYLDNKAEKEALSKLPPANISMIFFGMYNADHAPPEETLLPLFPEWERIISEIVYVPLDPQNQYDVAMLQKSVLTLVTEKPSIYIMDRGQFNKFIPQGLFLKLDELNINTDVELSDIAVKGKVEEDTEEHIYGLDLTDQLTKIFPQLGREMVVGITIHAGELQDNSIHFIEHFLNNQ